MYGFSKARRNILFNCETLAPDRAKNTFSRSPFSFPVKELMRADPDLMIYHLYLLSVSGIALGLFFTIIASVLSVVNSVMTPVEKFNGAVGLYTWNSLSGKSSRSSALVSAFDDSTTVLICNKYFCHRSCKEIFPSQASEPRTETKAPSVCLTFAREAWYRRAVLFQSLPVLPVPARLAAQPQAISIKRITSMRLLVFIDMPARLSRHCMRER